MSVAFNLLRKETLKDDWSFQYNCLKNIPTPYKKKAAVLALKKYKEKRSSGNLFLLELRDDAVVGDDELMLSDHAMKHAAEKYSIELSRVIAEYAADIEFQYIISLEYLKRKGVFLSKNLKKKDKDCLIARFKCSIWWRRQLRKLHARKSEKIGLSLGVVHRGAGAYCSDFAVERRREQKKRNFNILQQLEAENQDGDKYRLDDLAELGISNPAIKRSELMVRMRGFEEVAKKAGHIAEFYTVTCPSRFHARLSKAGQENKNYDGSTPDTAQKYLCKVWARIRSKLARDEIKYYGFRVAEAHHDGTPHWHLLLFMEKTAPKAIREVIKKYALQDSPNEKGAQKYRFGAVRIDESKGSATGYIAKYIAKNIDGFNVGEDEETGKSATESAERVEAWAATWGIRQFQQIGGAPVGVWRELRRLRDECSGDLEEARAAADCSDWAGYVSAQGGVFVKRSDLKIKIAKWEEIDEQTGEILHPPISRYGELIGGRVFGLLAGGVHHLTRFYHWVINVVNDAREFEFKTDVVKGFDLGGDSPPLEFCQ